MTMSGGGTWPESKTTCRLSFSGVPRTQKSGLFSRLAGLAAEEFDAEEFAAQKCCCRMDKLS
jgi:hypothetical protein